MLYRGSICLKICSRNNTNPSAKVLAHYRDLRQDLSEEGPCLATGRLAVTCTSGAAWRIFRSSWFRQRLQRVAGLPFRPGKMGKDSQSLGMEFREYRQNSSMLWHSDQILLDPPQLELVYTLENSSDSVTRWSPSHLHVLRNEIQQVWTAPNSGLLLQASMAKPGDFGNDFLGTLPIKHGNLTRKRFTPSNVGDLSVKKWEAW